MSHRSNRILHSIDSNDPVIVLDNSSQRSLVDSGTGNHSYHYVARIDPYSGTVIVDMYLRVRIDLLSTYSLPCKHNDVQESKSNQEKDHNQLAERRHCGINHID
jgi:hypothetical protein